MSTKRRFCTAKDAEYPGLVDRWYRGFVHEEPSALPGAVHQQFATCFGDLESADFFQADVTQQLGPGTPCARTMITRTLIGNPVMRDCTARSSKQPCI
jgi:hypothetical protein